jgi:hypothetical protein
MLRRVPASRAGALVWHNYWAAILGVCACALACVCMCACVTAYMHVIAGSLRPVLGGVGPLRVVVGVGGGVIDLVRLPASALAKGANPVDALATVRGLCCTAHVDCVRDCRRRLMCRWSCCHLAPN